MSKPNRRQRNAAKCAAKAAQASRGVLHKEVIRIPSRYVVRDTTHIIVDSSGKARVSRAMVL